MEEIKTIILVFTGFLVWVGLVLHFNEEFGGGFLSYMFMAVIVPLLVLTLCL